MFCIPSPLFYLDGFDIMRTVNAFTLTLASFVAGIFGFFLRWLQNLNGFDDNGLAVPGANITAVFVVYTLIVILAFVLEEKILFRKLHRSSLAAEALKMPNFVIRALSWVIAAIMVLGCLIYMFSSDFSRFPGMQRITSALGIFAGLSIPFIFGGKSEKEGGHGTVASLIPVLFGCLWLVTSYRIQSENPIRWAYAPSMLAIIALLLSFYYIAAYFYGKPKPGRCLFALQLCSYLCIITLIDGHSLAETLIFASGAAAALCLQFSILHNAVTPPEVPETVEEAQE